ncbi:MAG: 50S ribosomal protein L14e [Candidatus Woesearchaeota archaeon]
MFELGRVCMKIAGRDAGKIGVVVDTIDEKFVLIDGEVRRRKCNTQHLELTPKKVDIKAKATQKEICEALKAVGIEIEEKKETKKKTAAPRPKKQKTVKKKESDEKKPKLTKTEKKDEKDLPEK